jgi:hypothetical protein
MSSIQQTPVRVITDMNVKEHFRQTVVAALANQNVRAKEDTVYYLVNLLDHFSKSENLFSTTDNGPAIPPLALLYAQAVEANDVESKRYLLRRLGDVALLIGGVFPGSLSRKLVDVDYYIGMGGSAYSNLSDITHGSRQIRALRGVYAELSAKFQRFVDVLAEVSENSHLNSPTDTLRLYEIWAKTGSPRTAAKLRKRGIEPMASARAGRWN